MDEKFNFSSIAALVVDNDQYSIGILAQILRGFGLTKHTIVDRGEDAKTQLGRNKFDLIICDLVLPDMSGTDLLRWLRRHPDPPTQRAPIIVLTGYSQMSNVISARDSGANCVVKKPVAPKILFDHIVRSAMTDRPFVETPDYVGPCRRFRNTGPPDGIGRRKSDLSAVIGDAKGPNLSQDEIDAFVRPTRVAIE